MDERPLSDETPIVINGWIIDPSLLEQKRITRCRIAACKGGCCSHGVWVDLGQAYAIHDHAEIIAPFMPAKRRDPATWFAELHGDERGFPSGQYTGTTLVKDTTHPSGETCVFLRPEDRYCAIQAASIQHGLSSWALKPHYCCLYPLVDEYSKDGTTKRLMLDADNPLFDEGGGCYERCATRQHVFQVYAEEVAFVLGVDGYRELCLRMGVMPRL